MQTIPTIQAEQVKPLASPRTALLQMLKSLNEHEDAVYTFYIASTEPTKFIAQMRTELSRLRAELLRMGKVPRKFKLRMVDREVDLRNGVSRIAIRKQTKISNDRETAFKVMDLIAEQADANA